MQPDEMTRATLGLSALAGGAVWGLWHLMTTVFGGQPLHRRDMVLAGLNVAAAMMIGALVAYFLGSVVLPMVPVAALKDPHALGFGIGAVAWELLPFFYKAVRLLGAKKVEEVGK